jgi:flavoprotein
MRRSTKVEVAVYVEPSDYGEGEVTVDVVGKGWHTRYSGTVTKMWPIIASYLDENTAHNMIEEATGKGIDV